MISPHYERCNPRSCRKFLAGQQLPFEMADALWRQLTKLDEMSLARAVLHRIRDSETALVDEIPADTKVGDQLCHQEALLTSKDPELGVTMRHRTALKILSKRFDLEPASTATARRSESPAGS